VLSLSLSMADDLYDWINASWNGKPERRSGMITFLDADGQARRALAFTDALITEVAFPKLDGSSKDPCFLAVTLEPESTQRLKASGKPPPAAGTKARQWLACNFRVEIDGLDCKRVSKVEAFPVSARPADAVGEKREVAARLEYPNLTFALAELGSESWFARHDEYVIGGIGGDEHERKGSIALLDSALQDELGRIELDGLGIYRLRPEKAQASAGVARVVAELYCERMELAL
jgi:hypothetical protein